MLGIGIGILISTTLLSTKEKQVNTLSKSEIENKAREFGMVYRDEIKSILD